MMRAIMNATALPRPQRSQPPLGVLSVVDGSPWNAEDGQFDSAHPDQIAREAKRAYDRAYHAKRSPELKARKIALQRERQFRNLCEIRAYKASKGCADCGESDPIVLEFDHRDPTQKVDAIGDGHHKGWSMKKLMEEASKCDVVCANCHRRRTAAALWRSETRDRAESSAAGSNPATQTTTRTRTTRN